MIKESPQEVKEWDIKEIISKSVIYIGIKYLHYKEESLQEKKREKQEKWVNI
jgi:hypothetical protein